MSEELKQKLINIYKASQEFLDIVTLAEDSLYKEGRHNPTFQGDDMIRLYNYLQAHVCGNIMSAMTMISELCDY